MKFWVSFCFIFSTLTFAMEDSTQALEKSSTFSESVMESDAVNFIRFKPIKSISHNGATIINLAGVIAVSTGVIGLIYYSLNKEPSIIRLDTKEISNLCREIWLYWRGNFEFDHIANIDLSCPEIVDFFNKTNVNLHQIREYYLNGGDEKPIFMVGENKYDAYYKGILYLHQYNNVTIPIMSTEPKQLASIFWLSCVSTVFGVTGLVCNNIKRCAALIKKVGWCSKDQDDYSDDDDL